MKPTRPTPLLVLSLVGLVLGFLTEITAAASGVPILVPPITLPLTLVVFAGIALVLAWPIRRATRGLGGRVDPFRALRIVALAKASSLCGALLLGVGLGIVLFILTRSVVPTVTSLWLAIGTAIGAAILLTAGLVAERFCTLPPGDEDDDKTGGLHA